MLSLNLGVCLLTCIVSTAHAPGIPGKLLENYYYPVLLENTLNIVETISSVLSTNQKLQK